ncbi:hypothetical protein J2R78_001473 [Bradyrhizobium sp. USDA 4538]|nr:hypothetical protein [Bradyrhizobium sp. USDA 4538]MCP1899070.1 hypothetical protein [Bradyrhizobium sp. USDA 4537]MCP1986817.1 hypothetical protein [Bradyrhizobium sp. USDA 4539]
MQSIAPAISLSCSWSRRRERQQPPPSSKLDQWPSWCTNGTINEATVQGYEDRHDQPKLSLLTSPQLTTTLGGRRR